MKKNQKGSALLWAVVLLLIFDVVIAGAMGITYAYYNRSVATNSQRQAYLTSKGLIENVVEKISISDSFYLNLLVGLEVGDKNTLTFEVPTVANLGTARGSVEVVDPQDTRGRITITVSTIYKEESETVKADMQLVKNNNVLHWQLIRYYKGDPLPFEDNINVKNAKIYLNDMNAILAAWRSAGFDGLNSQIQKDSNGYNNLLRIKDVETWSMTYFSNSILRQYFFCRIGGSGSWIEFDKSAVKNKALLDRLTQPQYYIQTYFPKDSFTESMVYANGKNWEDGNWGAKLIYNAGHWYYVGKVILSDFIEDGSSDPKDLDMTFFDDKKDNSTTSSAERWSKFKAKYLTKENQLD